MLYNLIDLLRRAISRCYLCGLSNNADQPVCHRCQAYFTSNEIACIRCAMPNVAVANMMCGQCQQGHGFIDNAYAPWLYQPPLSNLIQDFKYHHHLFLAPFLSQCMLKETPERINHYDFLIPMPIHKKRLQYRGYNQTSLLSKTLSKRTGLPINQALCQRVIFKSPQASLNKADRLKNTDNVFQAKQVENKRLLLVDDMLTTGATANALAKVLKQQGALEVSLWCIARNANYPLSTTNFKAGLRY